MGYWYEVRTAKSEYELWRGENKEMFKTKKAAMARAKKLAKTLPYVYVEKIYGRPEDCESFEFIWSHNSNNW